MAIKMILVSGVAAALLCGCAEGYGYGYGGPEVVAYDGYYDDYYGPIYDGYWDGGVFFYRSHEGEGFRRDDAQHFRHQASSGFHHIGGNAHVSRAERRHQG